MALKTRNKLDINIKFPLKKSVEGAFQTNRETIQAVADDLKVLLNTNWGERPGNYYFGANLRSVLFEGGPDVADQAALLIRSAVERWMPYVAIDGVEAFNADSDTSLHPNQVKLSVKFRLAKTELVGEISIVSSV